MVLLPGGDGAWLSSAAWCVAGRALAPISESADSACVSAALEPRIAVEHTESELEQVARH